ncbi:MAG: dTDP-glucose 4,6-dehydratase [Candidatus Handelsmanbacteria bacterium RIFCSPLOWO2_12_FULL_64_10]|uniref:dTDP-glucose 4,6-dehydratase n=1 Tax=Handelsmanbacteria sp. (strain RIFCSPLOWO2_12_FULL_64_10) TaxID=1817868 RepID=A0A1F6CB78_HANXR|nr:MAG: dTDP-glucose 4,6-dehydratase [Candidatus Handelsmanbacteria bacterium RIFCSPLOWO2_12_FULL_64_10]
MKTVLVTGGAGFIGSNFVRHLLGAHEDYRVINLDRLTYAGNPDNLRDVEKDPRYEFVQGDICNRELVDFLMRQVDVVVNFAAESHVDRSIMGAEDFMRSNALGVYTLLDVTRRHNVERVLQVSTDEVYGTLREGESPWTEDAPLAPRNPYSVSKAAGDMMARAFAVTYGLPVVITRASNNIGPFQYPEKRVPLFITNAIDDLPLPVYGQGLAVRDHLYVTDHCEAIDLVLHRGAVGEVYNVGGENEANGIAVVEKILGFVEKPRTLIQYVKDRPGHDMRYSLDASKIRALGWRPRYNFESALRQTVAWYLEHQDWWRKIKESAEYRAYYERQYVKR